MGIFNFISKVADSFGDKPKQENANLKPMPGQICRVGCLCQARGDFTQCKQCLGKQESLQSIIKELELLEESVDYTPQQIKKMVSDEMSNECPVCGAPRESGGHCPYCGASYPKVDSVEGIPTSKVERMQYYDRKVAEAWDALLDYYITQSKISNTKIVYSKSLLERSVARIKKVAANQKMSVSIYISSVASGSLDFPL